MTCGFVQRNSLLKVRILKFDGKLLRGVGGTGNLDSHPSTRYPGCNRQQSDNPRRMSF